MFQLYRTIFFKSIYIQYSQYVSISFKQRFRIHKSDTKTNKDHCGIARHFNNKCCRPNKKNAYLKVQIIEQVFIDNQFSVLYLFIISYLYSMKKERLSKIAVFELMFSIFDDILSFLF